MWRRKATAPVLRCSFCGEPKEQVGHLVAGPHIIASPFARPVWSAVNDAIASVV